MKTCAIVAAKPTEFKFKYNENESRCKRLKKRLHDQFILLYEQGVRRFMVGGMLGVDMWSGEILLKLQLEPEYQDIELVAVIPYQDHDIKWDQRSRERLSFLIRHSVEKITIGTAFKPEIFRKKDRYLVDHAECLIAVYDNSSPTKSGTAMTVDYAVKKSLLVICIDPDRGIISRVPTEWS